MPNPITRGWKYAMAAMSGKLEERADPKIQIQQAIEDAQRQHQELTRTAASVIGNQRQLEMKLSRQLGEVERLQGATRQALTLADKSRSAGDTRKATEFEETAQTFATQLVSAEQQVEDLKKMHDQALSGAEQAKHAVEDNAHRLQQRLTERTQLLSQLEQAKMQEKVSASLSQVSELSAPGDTPSLGEVRDKIERRYANALGEAELAGNSVQGRMAEVEKSTLDIAGASRLDQIKMGMASEIGAGSGADQRAVGGAANAGAIGGSTAEEASSAESHEGRPEKTPHPDES